MDSPLIAETSTHPLKAEKKTSDHVNLKQFAADLNSALAILNQKDFDRNYSAVIVQIVIWEGSAREPHIGINGDIAKLKEVCARFGYVAQETLLPVDTRLAQRHCLTAVNDLGSALGRAFREAEQTEGRNIPRVLGVFYYNGHSVDDGRQGKLLWGW